MQEGKFNSLVGKILVASPNLEDKHFERSLVYIFMHDENGAVGAILNHKIGTISNKVLLKMLGKRASKKLADLDMPVVFGGPVNTQNIIALGLTEIEDSLNNKLESSKTTKKQYITLYSNLKMFIDERNKNAKAEDFILVRGISAWDSNQLENEIISNDWFIVQPDLRMIFSQKFENKWKFFIDQLGIGGDKCIVSYSGHA